MGYRTAVWYLKHQRAAKALARLHMCSLARAFAAAILKRMEQEKGSVQKHDL